MYEKAKGVQEDHAKAKELYETGCAKGDLASCTGLGFLFSKGEGVPQDKNKAQSLFREACDKGNGRACSGIGHQMRLAGDIQGAIPQMNKGCRLGYTRACFYEGALLMKSGKDTGRAYQAHQAACVGEDMRGCLAQAGMQISGNGVPPNASQGMALRDRALKELEAACQKKDSDACETIGDYYMGVYDKGAKKPVDAMKYYGDACSHGIDSVCMDLAAIFQKGEPPIPADQKAAKQFMELACGRGYQDACTKLGKKPAGGAVASNPQTQPQPQPKRQAGRTRSPIRQEALRSVAKRVVVRRNDRRVAEASSRARRTIGRGSSRRSRALRSRSTRHRDRGVRRSSGRRAARSGALRSRM
jgi:hypothetical protein